MVYHGPVYEVNSTFLALHCSMGRGISEAELWEWGWVLLGNFLGHGIQFVHDFLGGQKLVQ